MLSKIRVVVMLLVTLWVFFCALNFPDAKLIARYYEAAQLILHLLGMLLVTFSALLMIERCLFKWSLDGKLRPVLFSFALGIELLAPQGIGNNLAFALIVAVLFNPFWQPSWDGAQKET